MEQQEVTTPDRRSVVQVCGLIGLGLIGAPALAACGGSDSEATSTGNSAVPSASPSTETAASGAGGAVLAKLSDIPVGSALVTKGADGKPIVLVQATAGTVTAVSAVCTHKGVTVGVSGSELKCAAHGSVFAFDGAVKNGPAANPLAAVTVKVEGENVVAG